VIAIATGGASPPGPQGSGGLPTVSLTAITHNLQKKSPQMLEVPLVRANVKVWT